MIQATLKRQISQGADVHYSVIIPAYNEESFLPDTLAGLHLAMEAVTLQGEIIVVDNGSTDNTAEVAQKYGATVVPEPFRQIARARNSGAKAANGAFLIFLDADTILPPPLLKQALTLLESGTYCGGGTLLNFDSQLPFLAARLVKFWNWLSTTNRLAAGSFIFCLAQGFFAIDGFNEKTYAGEEVFLSRTLRGWGKKHNLLFTILEEHPVITSSRKFHWYSSLQIALLLLLFTVFPCALRSRSLCRFWYTRPAK
jgi:glycosyltransferase involved in cell wall biosynthesis